MTLTLRAVSDDSELLAMHALLEQAFLSKPSGAKEPTDLMRCEMERTVAAFDDAELVGCGRNYSLELVMPGGRSLPMAGVSWIGTSPAHRRRGVMRAVMEALIEDAAQRGEPLLGLGASEAVLYGRFGFGVTSRSASLVVDRAVKGLRSEIDRSGRLRLLSTPDARTLLPEAYARIAKTNGAVSRPDPWWGDEYFDDPYDERHWTFVVHESDDGVIDGFIRYTVEDRWPSGVPSHHAEVGDLQADGAAARLALWRFLLDLDLVAQVTVKLCPLDDPILVAAIDTRRVRVAEQGDDLWVRVLDITRCLEARTYALDGELVLEVDDPARPASGGTFRLTVESGTGKCQRTSAVSDLRLDVRELGSTLLGGTRWSHLARAGLIEEREAGAIARADAMFISDPLPHTATWF